MTDKFNIDSHKLMYHVKRVNDWLEGKVIYPIYIEVSTSGTCNHKCIFCSMDFMRNKTKFLNTKIFKNRLKEMSKIGVKSIMFAGEGEPLLHKDINDIISHTKEVGIDISLVTNGVLLNKEFVNKNLNNISWIKVSCAAGTKETYAKIHGTNTSDFNKVIKNLQYAVKIKNENNYKTVLGIQLLLLPDNVNEVESLTKIAKDIGLDYIVIKPYTYNSLTINRKYANIKYDDYMYLSDVLEKFNNDKFNVIFRKKSMNIWNEKERDYKECYGHNFTTYIDSDGNVWGCSCTHVGEKKFLYGNININSFSDIWTGNKRNKSLEWFNTKFDIQSCPINCKMNKANKYLWDLKHSIEHINFI